MQSEQKYNYAVGQRCVDTIRINSSNIESYDLGLLEHLVQEQKH